MALSTSTLFTLAIILRITLFTYGLYQDLHSPLKYTDIDYHVFTSASQYTSQSQSPYTRETYRYTPLLAWLLLPTTFNPAFIFFHFGKILFASCDIVAGYLLHVILMGRGMDAGRAGKYAAIWLLNPMVATISTRGSSEGILGVLVLGLLWAVLERRVGLAGCLLGLGVHFKIYPVVYGVSIVWFLDRETMGGFKSGKVSGKGKKVIKEGAEKKSEDVWGEITGFINRERIVLVTTSLMTFMSLNALMYYIYGYPFLQHTYLHHVTRIDHRHNFSPYNTLLYLRSAIPSSTPLALESLTFIPQLLLSLLLIPLTLSKHDLPSTMLAQTLAFVTFNKVVTSQYFLWYTCLLPLYLSTPSCTLIRSPRVGVLAATLWIATQAFWLQQAFELEFLGISTFVPGLWVASLLFFATNVWILGVIVRDVGRGPAAVQTKRDA
ncbi:26c356e8-353f-4dff-8deb-5fab8e07412a [Sclerotinia trifoliorum]|uniref:GPI mannosyltransferase 1 n=1 Tax=Sclerotinia trifoliorum TaxID=28548 RepID=A0A8H2W0L9_9HELO|nr:26c356e8-353f-4dff-8deb-5fab8e07412a [Sclerotinia trifoliorum]